MTRTTRASRTDLPPTTVNGLTLRRMLGREEWGIPERYGVDGWRLVHIDGNASVLVSVGPHIADPDGPDWIHASMTRADTVPSYDDLKLLHAAVFGDRWAYQVFAPPAHHVNYHTRALHLWGREDGAPVLPNFGMFGLV